MDDSKTVEKQLKKERVSICLLVVSAGIVVFLTIFVIWISTDIAKSILNRRAEMGMPMPLAGILNIFAIAGQSVFWTPPIVMSMVSKTQTKIKGVRIADLCVFIYSICGLITCLVVGIGINRWI